MIRVKGKLLSPIINLETREIRLARKGDEAEIELPEVDISKIKEGDEVLVKAKISNYGDNIAFGFGNMNVYGLENYIIAYFPKSDLPQRW